MDKYIYYYKFFILNNRLMLHQSLSLITWVGGIKLSQAFIVQHLCADRQIVWWSSDPNWLLIHSFSPVTCSPFSLSCRVTARTRLKINTRLLCCYFIWELVYPRWQAGRWLALGLELILIIQAGGESETSWFFSHLSHHQPLTSILPDLLAWQASDLTIDWVLWVTFWRPILYQHKMGIVKTSKLSMRPK